MSPSVFILNPYTNVCRADPRQLTDARVCLKEYIPTKDCKVKEISTVDISPLCGFFSVSKSLTGIPQAI